MQSGWLLGAGRLGLLIKLCKCFWPAGYRNYRVRLNWTIFLLAFPSNSKPFTVTYPHNQMILLNCLRGSGRIRSLWKQVPQMSSTSKLTASP